jgi:hypothetical protein
VSTSSRQYLNLSASYEENLLHFSMDIAPGLRFAALSILAMTINSPLFFPHFAPARRLERAPADAAFLCPSGLPPIKWAARLNYIASLVPDGMIKSTTGTETWKPKVYTGWRMLPLHFACTWPERRRQPKKNAIKSVCSARARAPQLASSILGEVFGRRTVAANLQLTQALAESRIARLR